MAFWSNWFKRSKEEEQKIKLLALIKEMIIFCNNLLVKLDKGYAIDSNIKIRIKKLKEKIEQTRHHLDDAYGFLDAPNINSSIDELIQADRYINFKDLDSHLDFLIKTNKRGDEYKFEKSDKDRIQFIRTNIARLIKDLPNFNLK
ncbi:MAG: hypothetical protein AABW45_00135 [Nanoarchaeota archaeon]